MASVGTLLHQSHTKGAISPLSLEAQSVNFQGFLNLCGILLFVTHFRLIIENLLKYGVLLKPPNPLLVLYDYRNWPCLSMVMLLHVFVLFAYCVEKQCKWLSSGVSMGLHVGNVGFVLVLPLLLTYKTTGDIISGGILLLVTAVTALKLISFTHVATQVRHAKQSKDWKALPEKLQATINQYPQSLTLKTYFYFLWAPTLCFQFEYPRTATVRLGWLLRRIGELAISLSLMIVLTQQYVYPLVLSTLPLLGNPETSIWQLLERHLRLAIPSLYVWLLMFYALFHCWLNILAEIMCFADREFYLDWWNSLTFGEFWRLWNRPVHQWVTRHLYHPLRSYGLSVPAAGVIVFFVSAIGHEYVVSGALKIVSYWAFLAMMAQVPLVMIMELLKGALAGTQVGNIIFWVCFCMVGEPIAVLIYAQNILNLARN